ncbi:hypothetical protein Kfla_6367 [Kribbella flavida DSM 17836]|uniref:Uncharacterized protein n=1 Tax=Kribbella flavida (strain DSM 17836 / JCM 10339 / NBRC 14399) TaxID=479435 RepID=D2PWY8_KRIFD|nr:hypothetical protein [Kribbella flavida]ADB35368.1 hypothetical protein Kfla_6367 [Kribbella flavida DSM 17836]
MSADPAEIARLSDELATAVTRARPVLQMVADDAFALAQQVARNSDDIQNLQRQASRVQEFRDVPPATILRGAMLDADEISSRLQRAAGQVDEIRGDLGRAERDLRHGSKVYAELVDTLGPEMPEATKDLGQRLQALSRAVETASSGLSAADRSIADVRQSVQQLTTTDLQADRFGTEQKIRTAHAGARDGAEGFEQRMKGVTAGLAQAEPDLQQATQQTQALAQAAQAALNPTPKAKQVKPGSASEQSGLAARLNGQSRSTDRDR